MLLSRVRVGAGEVVDSNPLVDLANRCRSCCGWECGSAVRVDESCGGGFRRIILAKRFRQIIGGDFPFPPGFRCVARS